MKATTPKSPLSFLFLSIIVSCSAAKAGTVSPPGWKKYFEIEPPSNAVNIYPARLAEGGSGNRYGTASVEYSDKRWASWIIGSGDGGSTWTFRSELTTDDSSRDLLQIGLKLWVDPLNRVFLAGGEMNKDLKFVSWMLWRSDDGAKTWKVVNRFVVSGSNYLAAYSVLSLGKQLFVTGVLNDAAGMDHWLVRMSEDDGKTWKIINEMDGPTADSSVASSIIADPSDNLYVGGWWSSPVKRSVAMTILRLNREDRIINGRQGRFAFSDIFQKISGMSSSVQGMFFGKTTGVWAVGRAADPDGGFCVARNSNDQGQTWITAALYRDQSLLAEGFNRCVVTDGLETKHGLVLVGSSRGPKGDPIGHLRWLGRNEKTWRMETFKIPNSTNTWDISAALKFQDGVQISARAQDASGKKTWVILGRDSYY